MTQLTIRRKEDGKVWKVPEEMNDFIGIVDNNRVDFDNISFDYDKEWRVNYHNGYEDTFQALDPALYEVLPSQEENERLREALESIITKIELTMGNSSENQHVVSIARAALEENKQ